MQGRGHTRHQAWRVWIGHPRFHHAGLLRTSNYGFCIGCTACSTPDSNLGNSTRSMAWTQTQDSRVSPAPPFWWSWVSPLSSRCRRLPPDRASEVARGAKARPPSALASRHGLILASDGSLWSWGSDCFDRLARPRAGQGQPQTRLWRIGNETNWVSISAGHSPQCGHQIGWHACGRGEKTFLAGSSAWGQPEGRSPMADIPVRAAPGHDWKQAVAGGIHTVAIKKDGTLWAWGNNWAGSLGTGSTSNSAVPVEVGSATNWVKVWAGILETRRAAIRWQSLVLGRESRSGCFLKAPASFWFPRAFPRTPTGWTWGSG